jgi:hypothetical protein
MQLSESEWSEKFSSFCNVLIYQKEKENEREGKREGEIEEGTSRKTDIKEGVRGGGKERGDGVRKEEENK